MSGQSHHFADKLRAGSGSENQSLQRTAATLVGSKFFDIVQAIATLAAAAELFSFGHRRLAVGHEVVVFGYIHGADTDRLHALNVAALADVPAEDEWPFLVRGMFALPERWPLGTYRTRVIHFGASLKDEPQDPALWDGWLSKFEAVLRRMCWWSATLHLSPESGPDRVYQWLPTPAAIGRACGDPPQPVQEWERSVVMLPARQAEPSAADVTMNVKARLRDDGTVG